MLYVFLSLPSVLLGLTFGEGYSSDGICDNGEILFTSRFTQQVQQAKVLLPRVLPYQPLLLGYDHPEGQLQNGFAKLDDQECIYELLQRIE